MKYGFVIDNRKCIGCHACTTACKSEHDVPIGVNRTWVKQVEKGSFPDTRRLFSVLRCNQCTDAPCVTICPTESLYIRKDGIVDFDKDRCIACKSCMQACPYDALYIDPETSTAAKCNYCAHRIDLGLEPACVNVCPEEAIISGDMENPDSTIADLLARYDVKTRKPEKNTIPNVFYIDADDVSLIPSYSEPTKDTLWSSQQHGVGHFAKEAEKLSFSNTDLIEELVKINGGFEKDGKTIKSPKTVEVLMDNTKAKNVYTTPNKGILWAWEVSAYVWTKAIATGVILLITIATITGIIVSDTELYISISVALIFLTLTGILLIKDLDQPKRFLYVLLRPHWSSWLVKGGYAITVFGGLLTLLGLSLFMNWTVLIVPLLCLTGVTAILVSVYTAFLFAQAKGRDFWQAPTLSFHMLVHSFMAGSATLLLLFSIFNPSCTWFSFLKNTLLISIVINLIILSIEIFGSHKSVDTNKVVSMISKGRYKNMFWFGAVLTGNLIPIALLILNKNINMILALTSIIILIGIYITEHIWVEAPQRITLS